jgi:hypothetical protein
VAGGKWQVDQLLGSGEVAGVPDGVHATPNCVRCGVRSSLEIDAQYVRRRVGSIYRHDEQGRPRRETGLSVVGAGELREGGGVGQGNCRVGSAEALAVTALFPQSLWF